MRKITINGVEFNAVGQSQLDNIEQVMSAEATRKRNADTLGFTYQVSDKDLTKLCDNANDAVLGCLDGVRAVGVLLANVNAEEVANDMASVGWLLVGLANMGIRLSDIRQAMDYDLANRE